MMPVDTKSSPQEDGMSQIQTPSRRRWTVRRGTNGHGADLFEVYAATMEEARASVITTANANMESLLMGGLVDTDGFTVHALERGAAGALPLGQNIYAQFTYTPELTDAATHTFI